MKEKPSKPILVTQPNLPDLGEYTKALEEIWDNKWLTNNGKFHKEFEEKLAKHLGVKYISLFSNGTLALMVALQELGIKGEVITTPYSFVATTHALQWNGNTPVFCDIDPVHGNIDVDKIEQHITSETSAILPVHVYGNPVDVDKIKSIADKYNLKVLYDAAHAFDVKRNGESILNFGDLSILSFHATKTFNTVEGGAIICHDPETKKRIDYLKNFGFQNEVTVVALGINAKMNELISAYGLLQLNTIKEQINKRKKVAEYYRKALENIKGIRFHTDIPNIEHNYSYFPIFVEDSYSMTRDELYDYLKQNNIYGRRYFYPLISEFPMYRGLPSSNHDNLIISNKLASQVICLPIYPDLDTPTLDYIISLIKH